VEVALILGVTKFLMKGRGGMPRSPPHGSLLCASIVLTSAKQCVCFSILFSARADICNCSRPTLAEQPAVSLKLNAAQQAALAELADTTPPLVIQARTEMSLPTESGLKPACGWMLPTPECANLM